MPSESRPSRRTKRDEEDPGSPPEDEKFEKKPPKWSLGILNDKETDEVPGSVLLLSKVSRRNEPLGLRHVAARTSASSLPSPFPQSRSHSVASRRSAVEEKKRTADGKIILDPQPDDSLNDPLNWPTWRRDAALISLGFYCMVGGGMTPILAAGFTNVAQTYNVTIPQVSLTTGLYMMGLGIGCVIASPTAILFGKRPVYLCAAIIFILASVWCALSPNYVSLLVARIIQGIAVSPVECLPSATVAEIYFLHERAYRLGIYTLLLLGGKNLVPLVSAAIIQSLGWRWVFWIVAIVVGFCLCLLFFFVPETFWDRTPHARKQPHGHSPATQSRWSISRLTHRQHQNLATPVDGPAEVTPSQQGFTLSLPATPGSIAHRRQNRHAHIAFAADDTISRDGNQRESNEPKSSSTSLAAHDDAWKVEPRGGVPPTPQLRNLNSPYYMEKAEETDYFSLNTGAPSTEHEAVEKPTAAHLPAIEESAGRTPLELQMPLRSALKSPTSPRTPRSHAPSVAPEILGVLPSPTSSKKAGPSSTGLSSGAEMPIVPYTEYYRSVPPKSYLHTLRPWSGRLRHENWFHVALRPFILFAYPSVLWSSVVYSLSIGWLIVLSESIATVYRTRNTYNFTALQVGLVYLSPFIGGVLGTAVAGKVSDVIVRFLSRRNDGVYEPEFRLVMGLPIAICTTIGLMGFGWSIDEHDKWIVPTIFFGIISFGCSLGSTTAITFCVDSYRQYAGEALVTLNFSKNIFHGLVFSLFFTRWLESDGPKDVFVAIGCIQLACLLFTIPMYIYGKRSRMWTVRKNLMEKF